MYSGRGIDEDALNNLPVDDSVFDQLPGSEYSAADGNTGSPMNVFAFTVIACALVRTCACVSSCAVSEYS